MAAPKTQVGKRRMKILRLLNVPEGQTVSAISSSLCLIPKTVLNHLHDLQAMGFVVRSDSRHWHLATGFNRRGFDGTALDSMEM